MRQNLCWGGGWGGRNYPSPGTETRPGRGWVLGRGSPPLEAPTGVEICVWADLTSGSPRVLDSASFCQVESSGEFRPGPTSPLHLGKPGLPTAVPKSAGAEAGSVRGNGGPAVG